jgi:hypothetical protein
MLVELLVRWTEMSVKPTDSEQANLSRLLEGKEVPDFTPEFSFAYSPMVLDLDDIARFNRSQDEQSTTLRMKDGDTFVVDVDYKEFRKLYVTGVGKNIHGLIEESKKTTKKGASNTKPESKGDDFDIDKL